MRMRSAASAALAAALGLAAPALHADIHDVRIAHFLFEPDVLTIRVGDTVRWTNHDAIEHTATAQTGPGTLVPSGAFDSGDLSLGGVFTHTFLAEGTFHYYCIPHGSSMQAVIIVQAAPPCPADFNRDGTLDPDDLADAIACYFATPACHEIDLNADGVIDPDDLADAIAAYFAGCP